MTDSRQNSEYVVIAGMGRTGLAAARYLRAQGHRVAMTDTRAVPPELAQIQALDASIVTRVGGFDASLLEGARRVVVSPGVATTGPFFEAARARGLEIIGDIELFARAARAPVVGITGTNGKSTVTTLVGLMAERANVAVRVGGNLGRQALELLDPPGAALYVLELSSFQIDTTDSLEFAAATVLNVTPDHLDRYGTLEAYAASKARIFARCRTAVINHDDPLVAAMVRADQHTVAFSIEANAAVDYTLDTDASSRTWLVRRGERLLAMDELHIQGLHNAANALAALALGEAVGLPLGAMLAALREFPGLDHRAQWVGDIRGVRYVNDSKGTNVGATLAAVAGMSGTLVIIAGGDGKGQDFSPLATAFRNKVRHTVLIGRDAEAIARALDGVCPVTFCKSLPDAVVEAARVAQSGDTVLLSPACASLDMFRDYAHRGAVFTESVRELAA